MRVVFSDGEMPNGDIEPILELVGSHRRASPSGAGVPNLAELFLCELAAETGRQTSRVTATGQWSDALGRSKPTRG